MDRHEQFGLASQPGGRIRGLEEILSEIDGTWQGRRDPERKSSRIHLLPRFVEDGMPARLEGLDNPREEPDDGVREDLHLLAERLPPPRPIAPKGRPASRT